MEATHCPQGIAHNELVVKGVPERRRDVSGARRDEAYAAFAAVSPDANRFITLTTFPENLACGDIWGFVWLRDEIASQMSAERVVRFYMLPGTTKGN